MREKRLKCNFSYGFLALGIVMIISGLAFAVGKVDTYSGYPLTSYSFGADFYTEIYNAVDTANSSIRSVNSNLALLIKAINTLGGTILLFAGIGVVMKSTKSLLLARAREADETDTAPAVPAKPEELPVIPKREEAAKNAESAKQTAAEEPETVEKKETSNVEAKSDAVEMEEAAVVEAEEVTVEEIPSETVESDSESTES